MNRRGHRGRVDGNHAAIMQELRNKAIACRSTAMVGDGFADIIASLRGVNVLLEVKQPGEKLTAAEEAFRDSWAGLYFVVTSPEEAVRVVVEAARPRSVECAP